SSGSPRFSRARGGGPCRDGFRQRKRRMCQQRSPRASRSFFDTAFRIALFAALALLVQQTLTAPAGAAPRSALPSAGPGAHAAALHQAAPDLDRAVLDLALSARAWAEANGGVRRTDVLTVIDYSLPSTQPRLWVFDLERDRLLFRELVAHGSGTGDNFAARFSNLDGTHESSLG